MTPRWISLAIDYFLVIVVTASSAPPGCRLELPASSAAEKRIFDFSGIYEMGRVRIDFLIEDETMDLHICPGDPPANVTSHPCGGNSYICIHPNSPEQLGGPNTNQIDAGSKLIGASFEEQVLILAYEGSTVCEKHWGVDSFTTVSKTFYRTTIRFECSDWNETPELQVIEGCHYYILWRTTAGCPVQESAVKDSCVLARATHSFDLRPLRRNTTYRIEGGGEVYYLNLCYGPVGGCSSDARVSGCRVSASDTTTMFTYSGSLLKYSLQKGLILEYKQIKGRGKAIVSFDCVKTGAEPTIKYMSQSGGDIRFSVATSATCPPVPSQCHFSYNDNENLSYDLTSLRRHNENWVVKTAFGSYYIGVCDALATVEGVPCTGGGIAACLVSSSNNQASSLGTHTEINVDTNHHLTLTYVGGSQCRDSRNSTGVHSLQLQLICNRSAKVLPPQFVKIHNCTHHMIWYTIAACPLKFSRGSDCRLRVRSNSDLTDHNYDFGTLRNPKEDYVFKDGAGGVGRINVCGPLVRPCNQENDVAVCLTDNSGKEIPIGRTGVDQPVFSNGKITFTFEGMTCNSSLSTRSIVTVIMMCNYSAVESQPQLIHSLGCHYFLEWSNAASCMERSFSECKVRSDSGDIYDLSVLTSDTDNYKVSLGGSGGRVFINVCHSVVPSPVSALCPPGSAACLVNTTSHRSTNIGRIRETDRPVIEDGLLKIYYRDGAICHSGSVNSISTVITFHCSREQIFTLPKLVSSQDCQYQFEWKTYAACPINRNVSHDYHNNDVVDKDSSGDPKSEGGSTRVVGGNSTSGGVGQPKDEPCTVTSPRTNRIIDLRSLMQMPYYEVDHIKLSICQPLHSECSSNPDSGSCALFGLLYVDFGQANGDLKYLEGGDVYLNYTKLSNEGGGGRDCWTVINFKCGHTDRGPSIDSNIDNCTIVVTWNTPLACVDQLVESCCRGGDSALCHLSGRDYYMPVGESQLVISICSPLNDSLPCPLGSASCLLTSNKKNKYNSTSAQGLGFPTLSSMAMNEDNVQLRYIDGSMCHELPDRSYSTLITFVCDPKVGNGRPEFRGLEECEYEVEWRTNAICARNIVNCSQAGSETLKHLMLLSNNRTYITATGSESEYRVSVCRSDDVVDCGSDVCVKKWGRGGSTGAWHSAVLLLSSYQFSPNRSALRFHKIVPFTDHTTDEECGAVLYFVCSTSVSDGRPVIVSDKPCNLTIVVETRRACQDGAEAAAIFPAPIPEPAKVYPGVPPLPHPVHPDPVQEVDTASSNAGLMAGIFVPLALIVVVIGAVFVIVKKKYVLCPRSSYENQFRYTKKTDILKRQRSLSEESSTSELIFIR